MFLSFELEFLVDSWAVRIGKYSVSSNEGVNEHTYSQKEAKKEESFVLINSTHFNSKFYIIYLNYPYSSMLFLLS